MKIYELLDSPEKWIKKNNARNSKGFGTDPTSKKAVCWCLEGALLRCYLKKPDYLKVRQLLSNFLWQKSYSSIIGWNDNPRRTYKQVINLCKKLDI